MAEQKIYPADTVDANGKAWETVGENIRYGAKDNLNEELIKFRHDTLDAMFPVGYIRRTITGNSKNRIHMATVCGRL